MNRSPVFLSAVGDANNISTWSGTPYHIVQAGKHLNIIDRGLSLHANTTSIKVRRILWNGYRFTTVRGVGGFQYSDFFQNTLWSQDPIPDHSTIIHCAQVFPKHILDNKTITKVLYLDLTLRQLFRGH